MTNMTPQCGARIERDPDGMVETREAEELPSNGTRIFPYMRLPSNGEREPGPSVLPPQQLT